MILMNNFLNRKIKNRKTKTINNSSSKLNEEIENNSYQRTNSNSANGFTKFINSIFSKLKGKK